jgi:hypothetical protein
MIQFHFAPLKVVCPKNAKQHSPTDVVISSIQTDAQRQFPLNIIFEWLLSLAAAWSFDRRTIFLIDLRQVRAKRRLQQLTELSAEIRQ